MNQGNVIFHPAFTEAIRAAAELEEERVKLQTVMGPQTFERVQTIIERQPAAKRAAFYGTIFEAVCAGEDFSQVETIEDIGGIYARFIVRRAFRE
ncbi:hypothetical protein [Caproiciproducens sp. CPB-2]|uniref:hypothetical protein n=1 Tax=Caproiciproducens sp. CPB-2 TaxID=3030017 RepID=UPI0023DBBCAB|nr:hypothetical protein [Caproiciproducens sp. CPB-2]MDF1495471.1 hypothetical protein [Caproiciproducens sp. CPB-2]